LSYEEVERKSKRYCRGGILLLALMDQVSDATTLIKLNQRVWQGSDNRAQPAIGQAVVENDRLSRGGFGSSHHHEAHISYPTMWGSFTKP
jgi:hypothetical protein